MITEIILKLNQEEYRILKIAIDIADKNGLHTESLKNTREMYQEFSTAFTAIRKIGETN